MCSILRSVWKFLSHPFIVYSLFCSPPPPPIVFGVDFNLPNGQLSFIFPVMSSDGNVTSFSQEICAINDNVIQGNITFTISINSDTEAQLGSVYQVTVTIVDDEEGAV